MATRFPATTRSACAGECGDCKSCAKCRDQDHNAQETSIDSITSTATDRKRAGGICGAVRRNGDWRSGVQR